MIHWSPSSHQLAIFSPKLDTFNQEPAQLPSAKSPLLSTLSSQQDPQLLKKLLVVVFDPVPTKVFPNFTL